MAERNLASLPRRDFLWKAPLVVAGAAGLFGCDSSRQQPSLPVRRTVQTAVSPHAPSTPDRIVERIFSPVDYTAAFKKMTRADGVQSVRLADGSVLWMDADTLHFGKNATNVHNTALLQKANTLDFTTVQGKYGDEQVDIPGKMWWPGPGIVEGNKVYNFGIETQGSGLNLTVDGSYLAIFDTAAIHHQPSSMTLEKKIPLVDRHGAPITTQWSGKIRVKNGWWLNGTRNTGNGIIGDFAFVPDGELENSRKWQMHYNAIPADAHLGNSFQIVPTDKGYLLATKRDDILGTDISLQRASSLVGPYEEYRRIPIKNPSPEDAKKGIVTYNLTMHPEQPSPQGKVLASICVNDVASGASQQDIVANYYPRFLYLPL